MLESGSVKLEVKKKTNPTSIQDTCLVSYSMPTDVERERERERERESDAI